MIIGLTTVADTIDFEPGMESILIGKHVEYLETERGTPAEEVLAASGWKSGEDNVLNFGSTNKAYWLRFSVRNRSEEDLFLLLNMPYLDHFELFNLDKMHSWQVGDIAPFQNRNVKSSFLTHRLSLKSIPQNYLVQVYSDQSVFLPLYIASQKSCSAMNKNQDLFFGVFSGTLGIIFISSLIVFFLVKDKLFIAYAGYVLSVYFTQSFVIGTGYQYFFTNSALWSKYGLALFTSLLGVGALQFIGMFLQLHLLPNIYKYILRILQIAFLLQLLLIILGFSVFSFFYINSLFFITDLFIVVVAISSSYYVGERGRYFLLAWVLFITGSILYTLNNLGMIEYSVLTNYLMPVGVCVETIMLSIMLGLRLRTILIRNDTISKKLQNKERTMQKKDQTGPATFDRTLS